MRTYFTFTVLFFFCLASFAQQKNLAEKLGYSKDAKLLIIHADDAGVCHAADSAIMLAYQKGVITSASIMVPCPWFTEMAAFAKSHPEMDWGVHLVLTSEWKNYKWRGVSTEPTPSLLDKNGYFYAANMGVGVNAKVDEVEKELRAQIEKAKAYGIKLTHIDTHMGSVLASADIMKMYQRLGKEYGLVALVPPAYLKMLAPRLLSSVDTTGVLVDNFIMAYAITTADKWKDFYNYNLQHLKPGLNELVFHLGFDNDELRAVTTGQTDYGSAWRQQDYDYATSPEFRAQLKQKGIYLVTWGEIQKVTYGK